MQDLKPNCLTSDGLEINFYLYSVDVNDRLMLECLIGSRDLKVARKSISDRSALGLLNKMECKIAFYQLKMNARESERER